MLPFLLTALCPLVLGAVLLYFTAVDGDALVFIHFLLLNKIHLAHEWVFPTFTPALCGGFVLGSDPQNLIFSLFQLPVLLTKNPVLGTQLGACAVTLVFGLGVSRWIRHFGITGRWEKLLAATLSTLTGYWMIHMKVGHFASHGIAFLPWILDQLEDLIAGFKGHDRRRWIAKKIVIFTVLFFLVINSGYVWLQVAVPLVVGRLGALCFGSRKDLPKTFLRITGIGAVAALLSLMLSVQRLVPLFTQTLKSFPREISIMGVIGDTLYLIKIVLTSLFSPFPLLNKTGESHIGPWWDYSAYMGAVTVILLLMGLRHAFRERGQPWLGLVFAAFIQFALVRTTHAVELMRLTIPVLSGVSYMFRGTIVFVLLASVIACWGLTALRTRFGPKVMTLVFILLCADLGWVYSHLGFYKKFAPGLNEIAYATPERYIAHGTTGGYIGQMGATRDVDLNDVRALMKGEGVHHCMNPLVGYANEFDHSQVSSTTPPEHEINPNQLNMNDVRMLFGTEARDGRFKASAWPLWPAADREAFDRFVQYRQVTPSPRGALALAIASVLSLLGLSFVGWRRAC